MMFKIDLSSNQSFLNVIKRDNKTYLLQVILIEYMNVSQTCVTLFTKPITASKTFRSTYLSSSSQR